MLIALDLGRDRGGPWERGEEESRTVSVSLPESLKRLQLGVQLTGCL